MRYRNYRKHNNSLGHYLANELYKGMKQNQKNEILNNDIETECSCQQKIYSKNLTPFNRFMSKRNLIILCIIILLCITIPIVASYFKKESIVKQVIIVSEECGLKDVEIVYIEKDTEYDWYDIGIQCSNFSDFSFWEMQNIENIISKDYNVFVDSFISKGKKYEVFDDTIYINGERFTIGNPDDDNESETNFRYWQGMNGTWTYRCERNCGDSCANCRSCVKGRENFGAECTFQYSASSNIGWIGCPLCGDVDYNYWHDWYDSVLKKSH